MSMIGNFVAVSDDDWLTLKSDPDSIVSLLYPDDENYEDVGERCLDVDKSWHVIHFLLTGSQWEGPAPQRNVILGGEELGPDVGYGPARILRREEVQQVARYLQSLPPAFVTENFDVARLADNHIYPDIWDQLDGDVNEEIGYFASYFDELREFYRFAADNSLHVIQYIS